MLSNPPYGKEWKKDQKEIEKEAELGFQGRFGAGLPRISDGQLLFLQTMLAKMKHKNGGSRIAIVMNGSPLFTGDAGSGESEIRRWIIEKDWLETIIALPNQLFYNTGIHTYIWIITNRKKDYHKGKVKLINAVDLYEKMRKSLGNKRNYISDEQIKKITELTLDGERSKLVKIFPNDFFGYRKITIERSKTDGKGKIIPDPELRDFENVPLDKDIHAYFEKEVKPHVPDAWISDDKKYRDHKDEQIGKVGYEISFTRYFYEYKPLRPLEEIGSEIKKLEQEIAGMLTDL